MKGWLLDIGVKKFGPSAIRGAILALVGLLAAHQEFLSTLGITYDKVANVVTIQLDALNTGLFVILTAATAGLIKVMNIEGKKVLPKKEPKV